MDRQDLADALTGSPYSLPIDEQGVFLLEEMLPRASNLEERCIQVRDRVAANLETPLGRATRASEIYESNAIEGKVATLAETYDILSSRNLWDAEAAIAQYTLVTALKDEPKIQDVTGLNAARLLVDQYLEDRSRPLVEADLRDMHGLILKGHHSAGAYKGYVNSIEGSAHIPTAPSDVPEAMQELVRWLRDSSAPLLWRAAVAHSWLTHIHPFDDGNGRMARLLANYILGFGCFPPLIVKNSSDRPRYINALGQSDQAGNIVPLTRVFLRVLNRGVGLMEAPDFAWQLFQDDLRTRQHTLYDRWKSVMDRFIDEVSGHLLLRGATLQLVGGLSPADFGLLRRRDKGGNAWLAKVCLPQEGSRDILLWLGFTSDATRRGLERDQTFPSIYLAERDPNQKASKPYMPLVLNTEPLHDELCLLIDDDRAVIRRGRRQRKLRMSEAAELWASLLSDILGRMEAVDA